MARSRRLVGRLEGRSGFRARAQTFRSADVNPGTDVRETYRAWKAEEGNLCDHSGNAGNGRGANGSELLIIERQVQSRAIYA